MSEIHKLELHGAIPVNAYIIADQGKCFIVDPGSQKEVIRDFVNSRNWEVQAILLTHAHLDHIGAVDCFDVPIMLHEYAREILMDDRLNGFDFFGQDRMFSTESLQFQTIGEGSVLTLGNTEVEVIATPGHTKGGISFLCNGELMVGDTIFKGAVGRWDLPSADISQLRNSVLKILDGHPDETQIHPGHGPSTSVGTEKATNPYYQQWKV